MVEISQKFVAFSEYMNFSLASPTDDKVPPGLDLRGRIG